MKIEVIKSRRKTICLKIKDSEHAVLSVPLRLSDKQIDKFLQSKKAWLEKNIKKLKAYEQFEHQFDFENFIYFDGKPVYPTNKLAIDFSSLSGDKKNRLIKQAYLSYFAEIENMAKELSLKTGLIYKQIKPTSSVRVWGSYNAEKVMKINWKLLILPKALWQYVICHELCHSLHMNHQPKFWKSVESICPNYRECKKQLNKYSFVLKNNL